MPNNPPTSPDGLLKLAERCEQTPVPDMALNADIAVAKGWVDVRCESYGVWRGAPSSCDKRRHVLRYTASLDAAMTLYLHVPERDPSNPRLASAEALRQRAAHD